MKNFISIKNLNKIYKNNFVALNNLNYDEDKPILCLDSDNFYLCDVISKWKGENCVFTINDTSENPIFSYVKTDDKTDDTINEEGMVLV